MVNYPYYQSPFMTRDQQQQIGIKGRPVSSIDEVRATTIDFDGSVFYFPDLANKKIYTKQINFDGTSTLNVYELKPMPLQASPQYVTREEFETVLARIQQQFAGTQMQSAPQIVSQPEEQTQAPVQPPSPPEFKF